MKTIFFQLLILISLVPMTSGATAMSDDRSKCYGLQTIASSHFAWKADFQRFLNDYDTLSFDLKYSASVSAMNSIVKRINQFRIAASVSGHEDVTNDASRLLDDIAAKNITPQGAIHVLKTGLINLEDAMDDLIYQAQVKNNCQLEQQSSDIRSPKIQSNTAI